MAKQDKINQGEGTSTPVELFNVATGETERIEGVELNEVEHTGSFDVVAAVTNELESIDAVDLSVIEGDVAKFGKAIDAVEFFKGKREFEIIKDDFYKKRDKVELTFEMMNIFKEKGLI